MNHDDSASEVSQDFRGDLADGYKQMAEDRDREAEAEEWTEGLLFDLE